MKLALITGGHRRIGGAIGAALARAGWTLALHSHREATPDYDAGEWAGFVADLADAAAVEALIPRIVAQFGAMPTLIVNSASRFVDDGVDDASAAGLAEHHAVNTAAPQLLAIAMARGGGEGAVVNIIDQRVRNPNRDQLTYTLSKTALAAATRTLAVALAPKIRVNAVAPGLTLPTAGYDDAMMMRARGLMPLDLLPDPADIADAVLYFANARAVTGQTLFVDGGASLKSFERDFNFL